jgi:hypothetical protein
MNIAWYLIKQDSMRVHIERRRNKNYMGILDLIIILLLLSWVGGFAFHIGGGLIHALLVIAVVVFVARMLGVAI